MAEGPVSGVSRGGMESKIAAAKMATSTGASVIIADGHVLHPLQALDGPTKQTLFMPNTTPTAARKRWLVAYQTDEACKLIGRRTVEIEGILGYRGRDEMIHRADLVLTGTSGNTDE